MTRLTRIVVGEIDFQLVGHMIYKTFELAVDRDVSTGDPLLFPIVALLYKVYECRIMYCTDTWQSILSKVRTVLLEVVRLFQI